MAYASMRLAILKNEATWYRMLAGFEAPSEMQPGEYSMGSGADGIRYNGLAERERQPQRRLPQQEWLGAEPEPQLVREQVERDLPVRRRPKLASFSPETSRGSFFLQALHPSAEHPADLGEGFGEGDILSIVERFQLPGDLEEELEQVELAPGPL